MPPNTRASAISETALEKLENDRAPGRDSDVTVKDVFSPKMEPRMNAAEPLIGSGRLADCAYGLRDSWCLTEHREGHLPEAEKLQRQILETRRKSVSSQSPELAISLDRLESTVWDEDRYGEAEQLDREAFAITTKTLGASHSLTLGIQTNLGGILVQEERYPEAEVMIRRAVDIERGTLGVKHPTALSALSILAVTQIKLGNFGEAEKLQEETREIEVLGPDHPETAGSTYNLACLAMRQGDRKKALRLLRDAINHGLPAAAAQGMKDDPDLEVLHGDTRFNALLVEVQKHAPVNPKAN
jgi:tetratricopeptide (TPR) repeat protein